MVVDTRRSHLLLMDRDVEQKDEFFGVKCPSFSAPNTEHTQPVTCDLFWFSQDAVAVGRLLDKVRVFAELTSER